MQRLLELPKMLLVTLLLCGGIALIVMINPPYTLCDSQIEVFKKSQMGFLYLDPRQKTAVTTQADHLTQLCKETNSPGGCYELFMKMKQLLTDLEHVPTECTGAINGMSEVHTALWKQMQLMAELAWGEKPPASFSDKLAWFDAADLSLFCRLKKNLEQAYGPDESVAFREKLFTQLPGATGLPRNQVWDMMLLSVNCSRYL